MPKRRKNPAEAPKGVTARKGSEPPPAVLNLEEVKQLMDLIVEKGISEFEIERSGLRWKIVRYGGSSPGAPQLVGEFAAAPAPSIRGPAHPPSPSHAESHGSTAEHSSGKTAAPKDLHVVRSPMVGTFYAAPAEGAQPFFRVGDHVEAGDVLCIIEAMKLMNEIETEVAGEIIECHVGNGQPVEYGEPLFDLRVKP